MYKVCEVFSRLYLKKTGGGGNSLWPPQTKLGFFSTPWTKTGIFLTHLRHKTVFFTPLGYVFFLRPPGHFCPFLPPSDNFSRKFYPLGQFFFVHVTPLGQLLSPFYPLRQFILTILFPLGIFSDNFTPLDTFSWDTHGQKIEVFYPKDKNKKIQYPSGQGDLTPRTFPPPSSLFNGIALTESNLWAKVSQKHPMAVYLWADTSNLAICWNRGTRSTISSRIL